MKMIRVIKANNNDVPMSIEEYRKELNRQSKNKFGKKMFTNINDDLRKRYDKALFFYNQMKKFNNMSSMDTGYSFWSEVFKEHNMNEPKDAFKIWWDL